MAAQRTMYQIVGRYMSGTEAVGYHLHCLTNGKSGRYTREQVAYLVGRGQVTNCEGQIYKDKLMLRGVGISLDSLPVQYENGEMRQADSLGKIRRGTSAGDALSQVLIVGTIKSGRNTVGYVVKNAGGGTADLSRAKVMELAANGRIGNARVQSANGTVILRGVGCNIDQLPSKSMVAR